MKKNVTDYEPPEALFVPDDDPFIFYSAIARVGKRILRPGGRVIVEINERFGKSVSAVFSKEGYHPVLVVKDFAGKDRVVSATLVPADPRFSLIKSGSFAKKLSSRVAMRT